MATPIKPLLLFLSSFVLSSCSQEIPEGKVLIREGIRYHQDTNEPITGTDVSYHNNGQLRQKGNLIAGKKEGLWEVFYENGQLKWRENYKAGKKEGLWSCFVGMVHCFSEKTTKTEESTVLQKITLSTTE